MHGNPCPLPTCSVVPLDTLHLSPASASATTHTEPAASADER
jgi:hypothetical protein